MCVGAAATNLQLRERLEDKVRALLASHVYAKNNPLEIDASQADDMWRALLWLTFAATHQQRCASDPILSAGIRERYARGDAQLPRLFVSRQVRPHRCYLYDALVEHWNSAEQVNHQFTLDWPFFGDRSEYTLPWPLWPTVGDQPLSREALEYFYAYAQRVSDENAGNSEYRLAASYLRAAMRAPEYPQNVLNDQNAHQYVVDEVWGTRGQRPRIRAGNAPLLERWNAQRLEQNTLWTRLYQTQRHLKEARAATERARQVLDQAVDDTIAQARRELVTARKREKQARMGADRRSKEEVPPALDALVGCGANPVRDELYALGWNYENEAWRRGAHQQQQQAAQQSSVPEQWFEWGDDYHTCERSCYLDAWLIAAVNVHNALRAGSALYRANYSDATLMLENVSILMERARTPNTLAREDDLDHLDSAARSWLAQKYGRDAVADWWSVYRTASEQRTFWQWISVADRLPADDSVDVQYRQFLLHEAKAHAWLWFQQKSNGQLDPSSGNAGTLQALHDDFDAFMSQWAVQNGAWGIATSSPRLDAAARDLGPEPLPRIPWLPYPTRFPRRITMIHGTVSLGYVVEPIDGRRIIIADGDRIETQHIARLNIVLRNDGPTTYTGSLRVRLQQDQDERTAVLHIARQGSTVDEREFNVLLGDQPFRPGDVRELAIEGVDVSLVILAQSGLAVAAVPNKVRVRVTDSNDTVGYTEWVSSSQVSVQRNRLLARLEDGNRLRDAFLVQQPVDAVHLVPFSRTLNEYTERTPRNVWIATPQLLVLHSDQVSVQARFDEHITLTYGEFSLLSLVLYDAARSRFVTLYRASPHWGASWYAFDSLHRGGGRAFPISASEFRKQLHCNMHRVVQAWYWRVGDADAETLRQQATVAERTQQQFRALAEQQQEVSDKDDEDERLVSTDLGPFWRGGGGGGGGGAEPEVPRQHASTTRGAGRGAGTRHPRPPTALRRRRHQGPTFSSVFVPFLHDVFNKVGQYPNLPYDVAAVRARVGADAWDALVRDARAFYAIVGTTWEQLRPTANGYIDDIFQEWALGTPPPESELPELIHERGVNPFADLDLHQNVPIAVAVGGPLQNHAIRILEGGRGRQRRG